jgi:hypothetical protein
VYGIESAAEDWTDRGVAVDEDLFWLPFAYVLPNEARYYLSDQGLEGYDSEDEGEVLRDPSWYRDEDVKSTPVRRQKRGIGDAPDELVEVVDVIEPDESVVRSDLEVISMDTQGMAPRSLLPHPIVWLDEFQQVAPVAQVTVPIPMPDNLGGMRDIPVVLRARKIWYLHSWSNWIILIKWRLW